MRIMIVGQSIALDRLVACSNTVLRGNFICKDRTEMSIMKCSGEALGQCKR
jgi:hypothetical protein